MFLLPSSWIAWKSEALWWLHLSPRSNTYVAQVIARLVSRSHRDILHDAGFIFRNIGSDSMREQAVEDQEIAGLGHDRHDLKSDCVRLPGIPIRRLGFSPFLQSSEEFGPPLESTHVGFMIDQR